LQSVRCSDTTERRRLVGYNYIDDRLYNQQTNEPAAVDKRHGADII